MDQGKATGSPAEEIVTPAAEDAAKAFAYLVSKCASGLYLELVESGHTDVRARNQIIHAFLDMAAGEACRVARREGREPNLEKWTKATTDAFQRAVKRTGDRSPTDASARMEEPPREVTIVPNSQAKSEVDG